MNWKTETMLEICIVNCCYNPSYRTLTIKTAFVRTVRRIVKPTARLNMSTKSITLRFNMKLRSFTISRGNLYDPSWYLQNPKQDTNYSQTTYRYLQIKPNNQSSQPTSSRSCCTLRRCPAPPASTRASAPRSVDPWCCRLRCPPFLVTRMH